MEYYINFAVMPALLRTVVTFILLMAFSCQTFSRAFIVFDYYANKAKYASNCINKSRPKMRCHGNCQMIKKLQKEEQNDAQQPQRKLQEKNEIVYISGTYFPKLSPSVYETMMQHGQNVLFIPPGLTARLLRPPIGNA